MIWEILKKIQFRELWRLTVLCVKHPLYVIPTINASKRCIAICNDLLGNTHHLHNPANAFRHAFWNVLIVSYCARRNKKTPRALAWAKRITDWHEEFSVNESLDRAMDLHNNKIGRLLAKDLFAQNEQKMIETVKKSMKNTKKVTKLKEIAQYKAQLVYLVE
ncbi:MAG: hypothetical protein ACI86C_000167 [Candidatus Latescibacterota bacterium]